MVDVTPPASEIYERLMASDDVSADPADRHALACIITAALADSDHPLTENLGLDRPALARLLDSIFPGACVLDDLVDADADAGQDAIEEADFRTMLLDGRRNGGEIEDWIARIVVRRSLRAGHLWTSLGLRTRKELSDLLHRHFPTLAERNTRGMRWKKFFYREMCQAEGIYLCKSPICDLCQDFNECFKPDDSP